MCDDRGVGWGVQLGIQLGVKLGVQLGVQLAVSFNNCQIRINNMDLQTCRHSYSETHTISYFDNPSVSVCYDY